MDLVLLCQGREKKRREGPHLPRRKKRKIALLLRRRRTSGSVASTQEGGKKGRVWLYSLNLGGEKKKGSTLHSGLENQHGRAVRPSFIAKGRKKKKRGKTPILSWARHRKGRGGERRGHNDLVGSSLVCAKQKNKKKGNRTRLRKRMRGNSNRHVLALCGRVSCFRKGRKGNVSDSLKRKEQRRVSHELAPP